MAKKQCDSEVSLRKCGSTWHWFVQDSHCGGSGSTNVGPKKYALARALRSVPAGTDIKIVTRDCYGRKVLKTERGIGQGR